MLQRTALEFTGITYYKKITKLLAILVLKKLYLKCAIGSNTCCVFTCNIMPIL